MSERDRIQGLPDMLSQLEAELRRLELWATTPPPEEALTSRLPFCCDTLSFPQWLQFVFLRRMRRLTESGASLPQACGIAPMAEEWFAASQTDSGRLLGILQNIDDLLTRHRHGGKTRRSDG